MSTDSFSLVSALALVEMAALLAMVPLIEKWVSANV
jgi:hypothetical protein